MFIFQDDRRPKRETEVKSLTKTKGENDSCLKLKAWSFSSYDKCLTDRSPENTVLAQRSQVNDSTNNNRIEHFHLLETKLLSTSV